MILRVLMALALTACALDGPTGEPAEPSRNVPPPVSRPADPPVDAGTDAPQNDL